MALCSASVLCAVFFFSPELATPELATMPWEWKWPKKTKKWNQDRKSMKRKEKGMEPTKER